MIKGLYAAASAMIANLTRHEAISHNVANLDTPGFKSLMISMDDFRETSVVYPPGPTAGGASSSTGLLSINQLAYLGELGLGVESGPPETDFAEAGLRGTGQPLDLAIQGPGFFQVQTPQGERYTRDGRFVLDAEGTLVSVDGYPLLSTNGQTITLPDGPISVSPDGNITVNDQVVAQIGLASFADPASELTRDMPNLFAASGGPTGEETGMIAQGYLEMSNANPAVLMTQMVAVSRAYEAAQQMVQVQDELLGRVVSSLGSF